MKDADHRSDVMPQAPAGCDQVTIVLPARNEAATVGNLLEAIGGMYPEAEVLLVDDGSTDSTADIARRAGARVIRQPYRKGNGAAVKRGAVEAKGDTLVFLDADGQHDPADISKLLYKMSEGYDMVVAARSGLGDQASIARWGANSFYNRLASWMVGNRIDDLTSGFRAVHRRKFLSFLYLLPNGFSYPTTSTMAFFRAGYSVGFVRSSFRKREGGEGHISVLRDGLRFLLIIFKIGTLYSPLKVYFPASVLTAGMGLLNYIATALSSSSWRFTNMTALLVSTGLVIFMLGLISEQLTNLQYRDSSAGDD
jgi:glycosyltransferase involved in cell wall biosynthesis